MMYKILNLARRVLSPRPQSLILSAILQVNAKNEAQDEGAFKARVAVEGVEDPLFVGLFAVIINSLREKRAIEVDVLQTRSINGAIGYGVKSTLARHWIVARLFNDQWARVYRSLIGKVVYRSQPLFWRFFRSKDRKDAVKLWAEMKISKTPENLRYRSIQIGDLVIDSYLRFRPSPIFKVHDPFVLMVIQQAVREVRLANQYFAEKKPKVYLSSYSTYIEHGIPVRAAVFNGVAVRVYGNIGGVGKKLSVNDTFHTPDTSKYRKYFDEKAVAEKSKALCLAESHLLHRLSGGIDVATSYMRTSAYIPSGEEVPNVAGAVVVFLHDFYDSPHVYHDLVFPDFWTWICFTIQTLCEAGIPFWLKPHPNQISLSAGALGELQKKFPKVRFISQKITNSELVSAGMICGVTVYGTIAHELAYLGVPSIACARHPHASFDFCRTAQNVDDYRRMLETPTVFPIDRDEMRRQALAFYYMHNLYGAPDEIELRSTFVNYIKSCSADKQEPADVANYLIKLKGLTAWRCHLAEIQKDIDCHE